MELRPLKPSDYQLFTLLSTSASLLLAELNKDVLEDTILINHHITHTVHTVQDCIVHIGQVYRQH